ncbi:MAG: inorganic phosphate transporter [Bacteroidota bacterium]|nr:inorganic phosphate transporter [Bacteroidota bacterium]
MTLLITIIVLALIFDYINGFHDAANSIATVVSTKVLSPFQAVVWAAFFNFVAFFISKYIFGEFGIADTVSKTVEANYVTLPIVFSGLIAAIIWNLTTWWLGIPSSSSHTLIGGFAGAAIAASGFGAIHSSTIILIASFIILAPLIGMLTGNIITIITMYVAQKSHPHKADKWFKRLQLFSSALLSIGHGLNDSQKVMGIIAAALISFSSKNPDVPSWMRMTDIQHIKDWVPIGCFTAIAFGTLTGGWKIIKTMGNNITKITPVEGFCAQTAGALTLYLTEVFKIPVSTTHTITGSIIGVGAVKRLSAVRWGVTKNLMVAWVLTIPVSAALAAFVYFLFGLTLHAV